MIEEALEKMAEFQDTMRKVEALSETTQDQIDELSGAIKNMAAAEPKKPEPAKPNRRWRRARKQALAVRPFPPMYKCATCNKYFVAPTSERCQCPTHKHRRKIA